jgi:hypothetical protein
MSTTERPPRRIPIAPGSDIAVALSDATREAQPVEFVSGTETMRFVPETSRDRLFAILDQIRAKNDDKDPDQVFADVTSVVESVRRENYERRQPRQGDR